MKSLVFLLLSFVLTSCGTTNFSNKEVFLDESGNPISSEEFQSRWRNPDIQYTRWDYQTDTARVATLSHPVYNRLEVTYPSFKNNLEKITGKEIPDGTILLLEFTFLDDLCSSKSTNNWNRNVVRSRKNFLGPIRAEMELNRPQVLYLKFFEEGIALQNNPDSPEEFFFSDTENFLRKTLFRNPSFCGSYALIKPNGQVLIRNGEQRADWMAEHLKPKVWNRLFPEAE